MANKGISLSDEERSTLASVVKEHGVRPVCDEACVRSAQSLYRALSGATVLPMTAAALLSACTRLEDARRAQHAGVAS